MEVETEPGPNLRLGLEPTVGCQGTCARSPEKLIPALGPRRRPRCGSSWRTPCWGDVTEVPQHHHKCRIWKQNLKLSSKLWSCFRHLTRLMRHECPKGHCYRPDCCFLRLDDKESKPDAAVRLPVAAYLRRWFKHKETIRSAPTRGEFRGIPARPFTHVQHAVAKYDSLYRRDPSTYRVRKLATFLWSISQKS